MDAASAALFGALARELASSAWLVLLTRRDESGGLALADDDRERIELGPLSRDDVHAIAVATPEAERLPPHVVELAVERSGGSPEFLLDLLAAAAAGNRDELPDSVGAATMARIDALDPRDGAVVRRAAVLGLTFHPRRLADVMAPDIPLPEEGFWDRLSSVFGREADGHVRFKRPALQEAAYASLPFKLRRELHKAVGLRLEHDQGRELDADPAVLSHHFSLAGDHARAHGYAMAAAKRATERFSHADAARLYRRAIEAGRADRGRGRPGGAGGGVGGARRSAPRDRRAGGRDASADRGSPAGARRSDRASAAVRPARGGREAKRVADGGGSLAEAGAAVRRAARRRRTLRRGGRGCARTSAASARVRHAGPRRSRHASKRSREAEPVGELRALAHACYMLDWALVESGRSGRGDALVACARDLPTQLGDPEHESHRAQQPRRARVLGRSLGRGDRALPAGRRVRRTRRHGRPTSRSRTATSARSSPIRGTWTRPRRTCSAHAGSGARRATGRSVALR